MVAVGGCNVVLACILVVVVMVVVAYLVMVMVYTLYIHGHRPLRPIGRH